MRKDIEFPKVEQVAMAVVLEDNEAGDPTWKAYLLNLKEVALNNVLIASRGYGTHEDREVKTSTLRHFVEQLPGQSYAPIETIVDNLLGLSNEFWVSFYLDEKMYDKKYVFLAESITEEHLTTVPLIGKKGIVIM
ncbi:MAG: hypothetical protein AAGB22_15720 [Bacteroidota bacterium]